MKSCQDLSKYVVDAFVLMYSYVPMYTRSYVWNLSIQLYLIVWNLYMLWFVNYVQFYP
jgi:hypothetical protein